MANLTYYRDTRNQMKTLALFFVVFRFTLSNAQLVPACLNHLGKPVDWWLIYYTPRSIREKNPHLGYMYMDSSSNQTTFSTHPGTGDGKSQPHGRTIDSIRALDLQSLAWNDQLIQAQNGKTSGSSAHAKLYMAYNKEKTYGFVVSHSIPKYPTPLSDGGFKRQIQNSQKKTGQHALCISLDSSLEIEQIIQNSCFIKPNIFHPRQLKTYCKNQKFPSKLYLSNTYSIGKTKVIGFYKNGNGSQFDLFSNAIAADLKSTIVVQFYGQGVNPVCRKPFRVFNSKEIVLAGEQWSRGSDHAKWAYTLNTTDYACFGDLNRQQSQQKRGGAYYCLKSPHLNSALRAINPNFQACD